MSFLVEHGSTVVLLGFVSVGSPRVRCMQCAAVASGESRYQRTLTGLPPVLRMVCVVDGRETVQWREAAAIRSVLARPRRCWRMSPGTNSPSAVLLELFVALHTAMPGTVEVGLPEGRRAP